jgi:ParB/RepB/Spo0J family partition protein
MEETQAKVPKKRERVDRFKQRGADRLKLDPVAELQEFGYVGQRREAREESIDGQAAMEQGQLPSWFQQFQLVLIDSVRPGPYQVRMLVDPEKDEQLRKQIETDLERHGTLQCIFVVSVDQDDEHFYNPKMGGHRRLKIAQVLGVKEVFIWIDSYDQEELARGTYFENNPGARQDLTIVEEGELFRRVQQRLGWTQTTIAERFSVEGGQPHVARCIQAASYPDDIRQMLFQDPERGMRAAEKLAQLEALGPERGREARVPLIEAFLKKKLSTDSIQIAVDRILGRASFEEGDQQEPALPIEQLRRLERATTARKSFGRYLREIGEARPSDEERAELEMLRQQIEAILART